MYRRLFAVCLFLTHKADEDDRNAHKGDVFESPYCVTRVGREIKIRLFVISVFFNFNLVIAIAVFSNKNVRYTVYEFVQ